jgi:serine-type D-Ala-D-Ala carboxypeptidase/endopeptidase (penicillin-binding protein 4)
MLEIVGSGFIGLLMQMLGQQPAKLVKIEPILWQEATIFALPMEPDPAVKDLLRQYIRGLAAEGANTSSQGVWIQSDWTEIAAYQGKVPISAASLTKIATTLAALEKWGTNYQFETPIYATGAIKNGVLEGDLVINGSGDPSFVWEEAIALGNSLNQLGINQVRGNLIVVGNFYMNYKSELPVTSKLLLQGLNEQLWPIEAREQYLTMPAKTPRPQVAIAGNVRLQTTLPEGSQLLLRHQSLTLAHIIKSMNIYSNNAIAQMLADDIGGASVVAQLAAQASGVPNSEIQLINGSGLGVDNRISPRAVCEMLMAIERKLRSQTSESLSIDDLFPVAGRDFQGTMKHRRLPAGTAIKTGTLSQVSALAGVIPTKELGLVRFAIINHGSGVEMFREQQDQFLQRLSQHWEIIPNQAISTVTSKTYLGDPSRNIVKKS